MIKRDRINAKEQQERDLTHKERHYIFSFIAVYSWLILLVVATIKAFALDLNISVFVLVVSSAYCLIEAMHEKIKWKSEKAL